MLNCSLSTPIFLSLSLIVSSLYSQLNNLMLVYSVVHPLCVPNQVLLGSGVDRGIFVALLLCLLLRLPKALFDNDSCEECSPSSPTSLPQ